ncbi:MAG: MgtC/SapB family protein [Clostridia bacterium]|nr:MgtC/SapB family protein [Clostridia bacterium]MBP3554419.1 MgtC/SapB family protein [Clostridia bacterium]MBQ8418974.1 MgtC/SapB family protein [Clostridia bacterium]
MDAWNWLVETTASWSALGILIRLLLALSVGLVIGIDREMKRRVAGIKTHILVCLGAALVMVTSQYMMMNFENSGDPARLGAQVISGVGFLGVGTIIVTGRNQVRGLTTAASIWVCACMGLAAGIGFIEGVLVTLLLLVFTLKVLGKLDVIVHRRSKTFDLYIEFKNNKGLTQFVDKMKANDVKLSMMQIGKGETEEDGPNAIVGVKLHEREREKFVDSLRREKYIKLIEQL